MATTSGIHLKAEACGWARKAKCAQKELHHLGMSVTEAWERAKASSPLNKVSAWDITVIIKSSHYWYHSRSALARIPRA
ncbi:hypothetical protein KFL_001450115 [Klebsormidium nitens]|uniref:Uncharacterized protein n=1 Tax=Klebsormidium nitens TaxID=105231 RepID=A0A1Y1I1P4_KLENI|nr:hypothetical protein KFL_001450115 [Klebsormidium nitens]|eukprot:GAQ83359.1 hypothetical protein KFL_001450115 [Klebsormidium nitens]